MKTLLANKVKEAAKQQFGVSNLAEAKKLALDTVNAAAAAPSQTEVTDLNCSDHSTSLKNWPRGELWRFYPTRIQI